MKQSKIAILIAAFLLVSSCGVILLDKELKHKTNQQVQLADIGEKKTGVLKSEFSSLGSVLLEEKVSVTAIIHPFTKSLFKTYQKASRGQNKNVTLRYIDSIKEKPLFVTLVVKDKVAVLSQLSQNDNSNLFKYIESKPKASIIMETSVVLPMEWMSFIPNSTSLEIISNNFGILELQMQLTDGNTKIIPLSNIIVFAYKNYSFCWTENNRGGIVLQNFVESGGACGKNASKKYHKIKEEQYSVRY